MRESNSALFYQFDEQELEVCDILLNLDNLIYLSSLSLNWATKRRRSNILDPAPPPPPAGGGGGGDGGGGGQSSSDHHHVAANSSASPALQMMTHQKDDKVQKNIQDKVEAASPATPLSFYPSESDDKSKHSIIKSSKTMTREKSLELIKDLTQSRDVLKREIESVKAYYNKLKAYNMELKAMKKEILRIQIPHPMNGGLSLGQRCEIPILPHQSMALGSQRREEFKYQYNSVTMPLLSSSTNGNGLRGMVNHVGPPFIPDLNVSAEEACRMESSQPSNYGMTREFSKAETAENRKIRRMLMAKKKNEQQSR